MRGESNLPVVSLLCVFALQLGSTGAFIFSVSPFVCMSRHCAILEGGQSPGGGVPSVHAHV